MKKYQKGQTLIMLIVFTSIFLVVTSAAVALLMVNSLAASKFEEGTRAFYIAESGVENTILRLLRDPNYSGVETIGVGDGNATITTSGAVQKTILSEGRSKNFLRKIQATVDYTNNILTIISWKEIP